MLNLNNEYLVINGVDSRDFCIYLIDGNIFDYALRDYETFQIPGRTGDLNIDRGRWQNVSVTFKCAAFENARERLDAWRAFILSGMGAKRDYKHTTGETGGFYRGYYGSYEIETSIEPEIYRTGMIKSVSSPELSLQGGGGYVEISFDCPPQKYLKSGREGIVYGSSALELENPTYYDARPLFKVQAASTNALISMKTVTRDQASGITYETDQTGIMIKTLDTFFIDCEARNASNGENNYNDKIEISNTDFPSLAGKVAISDVSSYTKIEAYDVTSLTIFPKWWTL